MRGLRADAENAERQATLEIEKGRITKLTICKRKSRA